MPQIGHDNGVVIVLPAGSIEQPGFDFGNTLALLGTDMKASNILHRPVGCGHRIGFIPDQGKGRVSQHSIQLTGLPD